MLDLLSDDKIIVAIIIGFSTMVVKYIIRPITIVMIKKIRQYRDILSRMEALVTDFKPNGGASTWDKIERIDKMVSQLYDSQITVMSLTRAVASSIGRAMFTANANGEVDWVNDRWLDLTGIPTVHAVGYGWLNGVHTDDREWVEGAWLSAMKTRRDFIEVFRLHHDITNKMVYVKMRAGPVFNRSTDALVGWVATIHETIEAE